MSPVSNSELHVTTETLYNNSALLRGLVSNVSHQQFHAVFSGTLTHDFRTNNFANVKNLVAV